jgi:hypothetical protein
MRRGWRRAKSRERARGKSPPAGGQDQCANPRPMVGQIGSSNVQTESEKETATEKSSKGNLHHARRTNWKSQADNRKAKTKTKDKRTRSR